MTPKLQVMNDVNYMNSEGEGEHSPEIFPARIITRAIAMSADPPIKNIFGS